MAPPPEVMKWLKRKYPKPAVDPDWLDGCYSWIESDLQLNPATELDAILQNVETQLLQSNLEGSMLPGTGLPLNIAELGNTKLQGPPILVEVVSMTDIGHSAFSLQNVRQVRMERADLAGLAGEEDENQDDGEEAGPVPKYPRSMLRLQLSDGTTVLEAIEYRKIPELELGVTPLGYKMLLKNVSIRRGIAWLEPANIVHKGYQTEERQAAQDEDFVRGLRVRIGKLDEDEHPVRAPAQPPQPNNAPPVAAPEPCPPRAVPKPPSVRSNRPVPPPPAMNRRSPLQNIDEPPEPGPSENHSGDAEQPRRRKVPAQHGGADSTTSRYFTAGSSGKAKDLANAIRLPPHRQSAITTLDSDDDRAVVETFGQQEGRSTIDKGKGRTANADADDGKSSEYDFDFSFDEGELVATLDKVEKEHVERGSSVATPAVVQRTAGSSNSGGAGTGDSDTIIIDDEEENDKENIPVPTRNVRRRVGQPRPVLVIDDEVIELSD